MNTSTDFNSDNKRNESNFLVGPKVLALITKVLEMSGPCARRRYFQRHVSFISIRFQ